MPGIKNEQMGTMVLEYFLLFRQNTVNGSNGKDLRFFLFHQRKKIIEHLLTLISKSLTENRTLRPGSFQRSISGYYQKISHLCSILDRLQIYKIILTYS